jgi:hypothetical protein
MSSMNQKGGNFGVAHVNNLCCNMSECQDVVGGHFWNSTVLSSAQ